jgi:hypothetical protein
MYTVDRQSSGSGSAPLRSSRVGVNEWRCSCWYTEIAVRVWTPPELATSTPE